MTGLDQFVFRGALVLARVSGFILLAPVFSSPGIPIRVKAIFAVTLTALLYSASQPATTPPSVAALPTALLGEAAIGALLGLSAALIFEAVQMAGQILGVQVGFSLVNVLDPQTQVDTPILALFYQTLTLLIFLRLDVHILLLRALASSYQYLPTGSSQLSGVVVESITRSFASIWFVGVQVAAPALVATMAADLVLAFIGRSAPQIPVLFIGLSVKTMLGSFVLASALLIWPSFFTSAFLNSVRRGEQWLHLVN